MAYWIAVAMAIVSIAVVIAPRRIEIAGVPLIWITAITTILAILIYEMIDSLAGSRHGKKARERQANSSPPFVSEVSRSAQRE